MINYRAMILASTYLKNDGEIQLDLPTSTSNFKRSKQLWDRLILGFPKRYKRQNRTFFYNIFHIKQYLSQTVQKSATSASC